MDEQNIKDEKRSEQLAQKVTPTAKERLFNTLKAMGHDKWDQNALLDMVNIVESKLVFDGKENYAEVINSINQYTSLINAKLVSLISDLDTTEARIRSEYEDRLASKEETIKDLQEKKSEQEKEKSTALKDAADSKTAQTVAEKNMHDAQKQLEKAEETVKDKESIIQMLSAKLNEAEGKLSGYDTLKASEASLKEQVTMVLHQKDLAETNLKNAEANNKELVEQKEKLGAEIKKAAEKAEKDAIIIAELREKEKSLTRDLKEQKHSMEQEHQLALERAITKAKNDMKEQIDILRDERTKLEVELNLMRNNGIGSRVVSDKK